MSDHDSYSDSSCQGELHPALPPREQFKPNKGALTAV